MQVESSVVTWKLMMSLHAGIAALHEASAGCARR